MALEDIPHSLVTDSVPQALQSTRDAVVAPRAVLLCHAPHEALDLLVDLREVFQSITSPWQLLLSCAVEYAQ